MSNIERAGKWVNGAGVTTLEIDEVGAKNASGYYLNNFERFSVQLLATNVDTFVWVCESGIWQVVSVAEAHSVAGGSGANVNVVVSPQCAAIASGTAQLAAAVDLTAVAPSHVFPALIASPTLIMRGDGVALDYSGTLTGLVGTLSITLGRVG